MGIKGYHVVNLSSGYVFGRDISRPYTIPNVCESRMSINPTRIRHIKINTNKNRIITANASRLPVPPGPPASTYSGSGSDRRPSHGMIPAAEPKVPWATGASPEPRPQAIQPASSSIGVVDVWRFDQHESDGNGDLPALPDGDVGPAVFDP